MIWILLANLTVLLAAFVQAATGLGFALIAVPLLALVDLSYLPGPMLFASLVLASIMTVVGRWHIEYKELYQLLPGLIIGTLAGAFLLQSISTTSLGLMFGMTIVAAVLLSIMGWKIKISQATLATFGFMSGLMGTVSAIHGPPLVILYRNQPIEKIRATIAFIFIAAYTLSLIALNQIGRFGWEEFLLGVYLIPGLLTGFTIAFFVYGRLPVQMLRALMLALAGTSGTILIVKTLIWN